MDSLDKQKLTSLGIPFEKITSHQHRIVDWHSKKMEHGIEVIDTLRTDNFGLLPLDWRCGKSKEPSIKEFVSFVPSAGASSRYFKNIRNGIQEGSFSNDYAGKNWQSLAVPIELFKFIENDNLENKKLVLSSLDLPKAFQKCTIDGLSFIEAKILEFSTNSKIFGQMYIVPPKFKSQIQNKFAKFGNIHFNGSIEYLEQGPSQSTLRFFENGSPVFEDSGNYSVVPGGHGTLKDLFLETKSIFPQCKSVFIVNIDNVIGNKPPASKATDIFLDNHSLVLNQIIQIRKYLENSMIEDATDACEKLMKDYPYPHPDEEVLKSVYKIDNKLIPLLKPLVSFFHLTKDTFAFFKSNDSDLSAIKKLYFRPVNSLGQVRSKGGEIGGTVVSAKTKIGELSICLELPHFSAKDFNHFLKNEHLATHFNPVFVAAELVDPNFYYKDSLNPFWIIAKKTFKGENVCYHETVLYEILGNSFFANVLFPEVQRLLFNPHKDIEDTKDKNMNHWFEEVIC